MKTRRDFIRGTVCATTGAALAGCVGVAGDAVDPSLTVFLSDIHVVPDDPKYLPYFSHTREQLAAYVDEILKMRPRPACVVTFGDLCFNHGEASSYAFAARQFAKLEAAGIDVIHGMGNHDRRDTFAAAFPAAVGRTRVAGRFVSVVDLGSADLVLLDSLQGKDGEVSGPVDGALDEAQQKWLMDVLPGWKRPVFVGAHHPARELAVGKKDMVTFLMECPSVMGWICGHDHVWRKESLVGWRANNEDSIRSLTLPSAGLWGDIGFVTFRTEATQAVAVLDQRGYWFNNGPRPGERTYALWQTIVEENRGQYCRFPYERPLRPKWSTLRKS